MNISNSPLITIIIPVFNGGENFKRCLQSAISQDHDDFEIIVVDNCSTDGSFEHTKQLASFCNKLTVYRNDQNLGRIGNWNKCLELSRGQYTKPIMANDYLRPDCLAVFTQFVSDHPDVTLFRTSMTSLINGQEIFSPHFNTNVKIFGEGLINGYIEQNLAAGPSFQLWKTSVFKNHNIRFDESMPWAADYDFAFKMNLYGPYLYIKQSLIVFDWGANRFHNQVTTDVKFIDEMKSRLKPFQEGLIEAEHKYKALLAQQLYRQRSINPVGDELFNTYREQIGQL